MRVLCRSATGGAVRLPLFQLTHATGSPYVEVGVFRWLDHIKAGVTDVLGSTLDITPTVLHLAGLELPTDRIFDGEIQIVLTNPERRCAQQS